jgi:hypothetical protein
MEEEVDRTRQDRLEKVSFQAEIALLACCKQFLGREEGLRSHLARKMGEEKVVEDSIQSGL